MIQSLQQCHSNTERLISANSVRSVITVWLWLCMLPNHHSTFKDNLHKILGRHLGLPGEALVGPAITLGHALHDEVLPVEAGEADVVAGVDDRSPHYGTTTAHTHQSHSRCRTETPFHQRYLSPSGG